MDTENWAGVGVIEGAVDAGFVVMEGGGGGLFDLPEEGGVAEVLEAGGGGPLSAAPLSPAQMEAAGLVAMGLGDQEVARLVGVCRQTVNKWKNHDVEFKAEVGERRAELWEGYRCRFRDMIPKALEIMQNALDYGDRKTAMRGAMFVLRCLQLDPVRAPK